MSNGERWITGRRCDEAMKRSKEKCITPFRYKWRCTGECSTCICCIVRYNTGIEHHIGVIKE